MDTVEIQQQSCTENQYRQTFQHILCRLVHPLQPILYQVVEQTSHRNSKERQRRHYIKLLLLQSEHYRHYARQADCEEKPPQFGSFRLGSSQFGTVAPEEKETVERTVFDADQADDGHNQQRYNALDNQRIQDVEPRRDRLHVQQATDHLVMQIVVEMMVNIRRNKDGHKKCHHPDNQYDTRRVDWEQNTLPAHH